MMRYAADCHDEYWQQVREQTKQHYTLAYRYWRCVIAEKDAWTDLHDWEQEDYEAVDSPGTYNYQQAYTMRDEAHAECIAAGVPGHIMMFAKRSAYAQYEYRNPDQWPGKNFIARHDPR